MHENWFRVGAGPEEEAIQLEFLLQRHKLTQAALSKVIGRTAAFVSERLQILRYPETLRLALRQGLLDVSVCRELMRILDVPHRDQLIGFALRSGCNTDTAKQWVTDWLATTVGADGKVRPRRGRPPAPTTQPTICQCAVCQAAVDLQESVLLRLCSDCAGLVLTPDRAMPVPVTVVAPSPVLPTR